MRLITLGREDSLTGWASADQVMPIDQAVAFFSDRIKANPKDAFAHLMRATATAKLMDDDPPGKPNKDMARKAAADFTETIRLDPKDATAYYGRGAIRSRLSEHDLAIADFTEAVRLAPEDVGPIAPSQSCPTRAAA